MPSKPSYSIILPTYKEYQNLIELLPNLIGALTKKKVRFEIIVTDDNSKDGTKEFIKKLARTFPVILLERTKTRGLASALIEGTQRATFEHIVHMDADQSHLPSDLLTLIANYEKSFKSSGTTVVIGSRFVKGSIYTGKPLLKRLVSAIGRTIVNTVGGIPVNDSSNNFRVFPKSLWLTIAPKVLQQGNVFLPQVLILMKRKGATFIELPTTYIERTKGSSKLSVRTEAVRFVKALPVLLKSR